jgi:hypothetical protein
MPFESLREHLLKGGIAPRHVRRYLAELSEHLDDLTAGQRELGYDGEDAQLRARALLGEDCELAAAMLEQKSLRSLPVRAPWLIFGLLPPVAGIAAAFLLIAPLALIANVLHMVSPAGIDAPDWFRSLAFSLTGFGNLALGPLVAIGFATLAFRQRMALPWPLVAIILIALLDLQFSAHFRRHSWYRSDRLDIPCAKLAGNLAAVGGAVAADFAAGFLAFPEARDHLTPCGAGSSERSGRHWPCWFKPAFCCWCCCRHRVHRRRTGFHTKPSCSLRRWPHQRLR